MAVLLVIAVRLLVPFAIPRWPFWGGVAAIIADTFDFTVLNAAGNGPLGGDNYQRFDKLFDVYTLFFMLYASSKLVESRARKTLSVLFSWRLFGVFLFELTGIRQILFFTPNIFEYFYLLVFGSKKFRPALSLENRKTLLTLFVIAAIPKLIFEYFLHFREYPLGLGMIWRGLRAWLGV